MKTTPELIMRTNNLSGTMLRIGDRLLISHPEFSLFVQRKGQSVVLLDKGQFFKRYRVKNVKLGAKQPPRLTDEGGGDFRLARRQAGRLRHEGIHRQLRWIRLAAPGYYLYVEPEPNRPQPGGVPPPPTGFGMAAQDVEELSGLVNNKTAVTITD